MFDELLFMWKYGPYLVGISGMLLVLVLLRCLLSGCCCCSCGGGGESAVEDNSHAISHAPAQTNAVGRHAPIRPVVVADQCICTISAVVTSLLPVAVWFAAVAIRQDYVEHYEECTRDSHVEWEEAFDFYCKWCILNVQHGLSKQPCDTSLSVLKYSKHFPRDDVCHRDSALHDLTHHYRTCAIRGVLSHIPHWSSSDDPNSYQSVVMIQTLSSSITYLFVLALAVAVIVVLLVCKATPSMLNQAVKSYQVSREYRIASANRKKAESEVDHDMNTIQTRYKELAKVDGSGLPPQHPDTQRGVTTYTPIEFPVDAAAETASSMRWFDVPLEITAPDREPHNQRQIRQT